MNIPIGLTPIVASDATSETNTTRSKRGIDMRMVGERVNLYQKRRDLGNSYNANQADSNTQTE